MSPPSATEFARIVDSLLSLKAAYKTQMLGPDNATSVQPKQLLTSWWIGLSMSFADSKPDIEDFLSSGDSELRPYLLRPHLLRELLILELTLRHNGGEQLVLDEYLPRFPDDRIVVEAAFLGELRECSHDNRRPNMSCD